MSLFDTAIGGLGGGTRDALNKARVSGEVRAEIEIILTHFNIRRANVFGASDSPELSNEPYPLETPIENSHNSVAVRLCNDAKLDTSRNSAICRRSL